MNRKVNFARFHQSLHLAGIGEIGPTLPSTSKTIPGLNMTETDSGIQVITQARRFVVPYANVVIYSYDEESPKGKEE